MCRGVKPPVCGGVEICNFQKRGCAKGSAPHTLAPVVGKVDPGGAFCRREVDVGAGPSAAPARLALFRNAVRRRVKALHSHKKKSRIFWEPYFSPPGDNGRRFWTVRLSWRDRITSSGFSAFASGKAPLPHSLFPARASSLFASPRRVFSLFPPTFSLPLFFLRPSLFLLHRALAPKYQA